MQAAGWPICLGVEPQVSAADAALTVTLQMGQPAACTFYNHQEETAGPDLPGTGPPPFLTLLSIGGMWALLAGPALWLWASGKQSGRT